MKPSICRAVIYTDHDGRKHPAVVTSVGSLVEGEKVNLHVMVDGGGTKWVQNVLQALESLPHTWMWPPRQ